MVDKNNEDYNQGYEDGKEFGLDQGRRLQKSTWDWEEACNYWFAGFIGFVVIGLGTFLIGEGIWHFIHWAAQQDPPRSMICIQNIDCH